MRFSPASETTFQETRLALVLVSVVGFCLAGCGVGDDDGEDPLADDADGGVPEFVGLRVDVAGQPSELGDEGETWISDAGFHDGGIPFRFEEPVDTLDLAAAAPLEVYSMVRHGDHRYHFTEVPDGRMLLRLHFNDGLEVHSRRMRISAEGQVLVHGFSPGELAGVPNTIVVRDFVVQVTGGDGLDLEFSKADGDDVFVAGIEVLPAEDGLALSPEPAALPKDGVGADLPVPEDAGWLTELTGGGGAAVWSDGETIRLCEVGGAEEELIGAGTAPEFSPSGALFAWVDDTEIKARSRTAGSQISTIASGVDSAGGVHWDGDDGIVARFVDRSGRGVWARVSLGGDIEPLPDLDEIADVGKEVDIRRRGANDWSVVSDRTWRMTGGAQGHIGGGASASLSPDGMTVTALGIGRRVVWLNALQRDALQSLVEWRYEGFLGNVRWASGDARFLTGVSLAASRFAVIEVSTGRAVVLGIPSVSDPALLHGDFTSGPDEGLRLDLSSAAAPDGHDIVAASLATVPELGEHGLLDGDVSAWPGADGELIFLWEDAGSENVVTDLQSGRRRAADGVFVSPARYSSHGGIDLWGGGFRPTPIGKPLREQVIEATAFYLEMSLRTSSPGQSNRGRIIGTEAMDVDGDEASALPNFQLEDVGGELWWSLRTDSVADEEEVPSWRLGVLGHGTDHHLCITYRPNEMVAYLDGEEVLRTDQLGGNLWCWAEQDLAIGGGGPEFGWKGQVEAIAIGGRFADNDFVESQRKLAIERRSDRSEPRRLNVSARLVAMADVPESAALDGCLDCVVEHVYALESTEDGSQVGGDGFFSVWHWAYLGGERQALGMKLGEAYMIDVEPVASYSQRVATKMIRADVDDSVFLGGVPPAPGEERPKSRFRNYFVDVTERSWVRLGNDEEGSRAEQPAVRAEHVVRPPQP